MYVIKKVNIAICFWFLSIAVSLTAGDAVGSFFTSLGFDDRLTNYLIAGSNEAKWPGCSLIQDLDGIF